MEEMRNIIELIYQGKENILDEKIKQINLNIKNRIKKIDINEMFEKILDKKDLEQIVEAIKENDNIKMAEYNREFYKEGFIDGVNLMINCFKKE